MRSSILCSALLLLASAAGAGERHVDRAGSTISFAVERTGAVVEGSFTRFTASASGDPSHPERSAIDLTIESASIDTANSFRDEHLRSEDFLGAAEFPELHFASTRIVRKTSTRFLVDGNLTIRGVTQPVSFIASVRETSGRLKVTLTTTIRRSSFGVGTGDFTDRLISDVVKIQATLSLLPAVR